MSPTGYATPAERSLAGRIGAAERWAREPDRVAATAPARKGRFARYLAQVDAEMPGLSESERQRRAEDLRRADMSRMALKSAQARRARRGGAR